MNRKTKRRKVR